VNVETSNLVRGLTIASASLHEWGVVTSHEQI